MKSKTIKSVIRRKIQAWAQSIEDEEIRSLVMAETVVTGGCIASMLLQEKVNDFDVYFRTRATAYRVAAYYLNRWQASRPESTKDIKVYLADDAGQPAQLIDNGRIKIVVKSAGVIGENETPKYDYFEQSPDPDDAAEEYLDAVIQTVDEQAEPESAPKKDYRPVFLSANAITLSNQVQLIIRFWGEPDQIHENYDFVHCTNYWTSWDGALVLRPAALEALLTRELVYIGSRYPLCSVIRTRKFIQRGWKITAAQYLKMCFQLSDLDFSDMKVLEDQMTGVDAAYFSEVLRLYQQEKGEGAMDKPLDRAYLIQLLDKIV